MCIYLLPFVPLNNFQSQVGSGEQTDDECGEVYGEFGEEKKMSGISRHTKKDKSPISSSFFRQRKKFTEYAKNSETKNSNIVTLVAR